MKVYKTKPTKYGWYLVIHKNKNGQIKVWRKSLNREYKRFESYIYIWEKEELKLLKKALRTHKV